MPLRIHPGHGYDVILTYTQADGQAAAIDGEPRVELSDPRLAATRQDAFDRATGQLVVVIDHTGAVGEVTLTVSAQADLGEGVQPIVWSEIFSLLAPTGAEAPSVTLGSERPSAEPAQ